MDTGTEAHHQAWLMARAEARGWWVYHDRDSRGANAGLPDLLLVWRIECGACPGPAPVMWVELKRRGGGHRTEAQRAVANRLAAWGQVVQEWRLPDDMPLAVAMLGLSDNQDAPVGREDAPGGASKPKRDRGIIPAETRAAAAAYGPRVVAALEVDAGREGKLR